MAGNRITWDIGRYDPDTHYVYRDSAPIDKKNLPTPLVTLGQGVSVYEDTDVIEGNSYYYRVDSEKKGLYLFGSGMLRPASNIFVYTASDDKSAKKIDLNGNEAWTYKNTTEVKHVVADSNGNIYIASGDDYKLMKLDPNGNLIWTFESKANGNSNGHSSDIYALDIDTNDNVYTGTGYPNEVRKIDPDGNQMWIFSGHTNALGAIVTDSVNGYVYSTSFDDKIRKIDISTGNEITNEANWPFSNLSEYLNSMVIDSSANIYAGSGDAIIRKINSNGNIVWTFESQANGNSDGHSSTVYGLVIDSSGNIYSGSADRTVKKIDSSGSIIWTFESKANGNPDGHTGNIHGVAIDSDDNVYSTGYDKMIKKIDPNGNLVWSIIKHVNYVRDIVAS